MSDETDEPREEAESTTSEPGIYQYSSQSPTASPTQHPTNEPTKPPQPSQDEGSASSLDGDVLADGMVSSNEVQLKETQRLRNENAELKKNLNGANEINKYYEMTLQMKNEEIIKLREELAKEKSKNDGLVYQVLLEAADKVSGKAKEKSKEKDKQSDDHAALQASSSTGSEAPHESIEQSENEAETLQAEEDETQNSNEEIVGNLEKQIDVEKSINKKNENSAKLVQESTDAQQEIEKYKNNEQALRSEVAQLKDPTAAQQALLNKNLQTQIEVINQMPKILDRLKTKIVKLKNEKQSLKQQLNEERKSNAKKFNDIKKTMEDLRQVIVEKQKELEKVYQQSVEIERLTKQKAIGKTSDDKSSAELKKQIVLLQKDVVRLQKELQDKEKELTEYRKSRLAEDEQARQSKGNWETKEREYQQEISGYKSEIDALKSTQSSLESNLAISQKDRVKLQKDLQDKENEFAEYRESRTAEEESKIDALKSTQATLESNAEEAGSDDEKEELLPNLQSTQKAEAKTEDNSGSDTAVDMRTPDDIIGDNLAKNAQGWVLNWYTSYQFLVSIALLAFMEEEDSIGCVVVLWLILLACLFIPLGLYLRNKNGYTDFGTQYCILFALILPVELEAYKFFISLIFGDANSATKAMAVIVRGIAMLIWMIIKNK